MNAVSVRDVLSATLQLAAPPHAIASRTTACEPLGDTSVAPKRNAGITRGNASCCRLGTARVPSQLSPVRSGFSASQRISGSTAHTWAKATDESRGSSTTAPGQSWSGLRTLPEVTKSSGRGFVRPGSATQTGQRAGSPDASAAPPEGVGSELMGVFVPSS